MAARGGGMRFYKEYTFTRRFGGHFSPPTQNSPRRHLEHAQFISHAPLYDVTALSGLLLPLS